MVSLSIIIPVYNMAESIGDSIISVYNQSFQDYEIICIDDCSTDNSYEILKNYSLKDDKISIYKMKKNSGAGKCRNLGLSKAKGKYVAFLDSDDIFYDDKSLEVLISEAEKSGANMVSGNMVFKSWDNHIKKYTFKNYNHIFKPVKSFKKLSPDVYGIPWYYYRNIFRLSFLRKNNIKFPDLKRGQDTVFLASILSRIDYYLQVPIDFYQYTTPLEIKLNNSIKYIDYFKSFKMVLNIFMKNNLNNLFKEVYNELLKYSY